MKLDKTHSAKRGSDFLLKKGDFVNCYLDGKCKEPPNVDGPFWIILCPEISFLKGLGYCVELEINGIMLKKRKYYLDYNIMAPNYLTDLSTNRITTMGGDDLVSYIKEN